MNQAALDQLQPGAPLFWATPGHKTAVRVVYERPVGADGRILVTLPDGTQRSVNVRNCRVRNELTQ